MNRILSRLGVGVSLAVLALGMSAPIASAATTPAATPKTGQALEIAPPVVTLTVNPGQSTSAQIYLRDVAPSAVVVTGEVNDFTAAGEDGTPKLLLKDEGNNPYSLKPWITSLPTLQLAPREMKTFTVKLNVPADASPGGHYGVIRFTASAPELNGTGVALSASLGALILVKVNGPTKESLKVEEFYVKNDEGQRANFESTPLTFVERIKNDGNVHEQPSGQVTITDMFGKKVALVNVNLPPRNILPNSIRRFEQKLDKSVLGTRKLFGHYTATLKMTYGTDKKVVTSKTSFWVIPYRLIAGFIVVVVGGFFLLRYLLRHYNKRVINKHQKTSKK